ncbi:10413_t:CDS:2, partial [Dentiscutata erythropus]
MIEELQEEFNELNGQTNQVEDNETSLPQQDNEISNNQLEFDKYLAITQIEQTEENNLLTWWKQQELTFSMLCLLARKYLFIPVSSVPSKCLFSD